MNITIPKPVRNAGIKAPFQLLLNSPNGTPGAPQDPSVSGTSANFTVNFGNNKIYFPEGARVALDKWSFNNSIFNISSNLKNNLIGYTPDPSIPADTVSITLPDGNYALSDISNYLQAVMIANGVPQSSLITLSVNLSTLQCFVNLGDGTYKLDLTQGTLWQQIGALEQEIVISSGLLDNVVNLFQVSNLLLHTNLISGFTTFLNSGSSDILYNAPITVGAGYFQPENPTYKAFLPVASRELSEITIYITDQNNNPISFQGQPQNIGLIFDYTHAINP